MLQTDKKVALTSQDGNWKNALEIRTMNVYVEVTNET